MHLIHLHSTGFRGLKDVHFEPGEGLTVLRGHNAQGKTSLLEAILYAATSKSHRTNRETDLPAHGAHGFRLSVGARRRDREVVIEARWWEGVKRFKVNGVALTRVSDILGKINVVLFSPDDVVLVSGTAAHRRRFLDMELSQIRPVYLNALQQYRQALRQRNGLLRQAEPDTELLDVWDQQLAEHGTVLIREREAFVAELAELAEVAYGRIAAGERLEVAYRPDIPADGSLGPALGKGRAADLHRHMTLRGPHRDDLGVRIAGRPARDFASQGQQKTAALALKLAEAALIRRRAGEYPILMLDEALAELDAKRSRRLLDAVGDETQCLLTTTDLAPNDLFGAACCSYLIEDGRLERQ